MLSFVHVYTYFHPMSSWQGGVIQGLDVQNQDHQGIAALVPATGGGVN